MKYILLIGLICLGLGLGYSIFCPTPNPQHGGQSATLETNVHPMSHNDSINTFVEWYDDMCNIFCSLNDLSDFKKVGPQKNAELKNLFSTWHIKLSPTDKKLIERSFKGNLKRLMVHSCNLMKISGHLEQDINDEQIDLMVHMGETGFDVLMDTTTYLDYYVKWTVDNYNPPTGD